MRRFLYTAPEIGKLKASLSPERLFTYLKLAKGVELEAIRRYEVNTALSESLYGVLQGFAVALRNSMHDTMKREIGKEDWYYHLNLETREMESIYKAEAKIVKKKKSVTVPRVISELTFGFWSALASRHYATKIWIPHLNKAFPYKRLGHRDAFARLDTIRVLRNQVAHHECILGRDLAQDYIIIIGAAAWICPDTSNWIRQTTRFEAAFRRFQGTPIQVPSSEPPL